MKDVIDKEFKELLKTGVLRDKSSADKEETLDFLGHAFTMSELSGIASFSAKLKKAATAIESKGSVPEGTVLMVKVFGNDILVSFAGLARR